MRAWLCVPVYSGFNPKAQCFGLTRLVTEKLIDITEKTQWI
jgi:hypothetical protein